MLRHLLLSLLTTVVSCDIDSRNGQHSLARGELVKSSRDVGPIRVEALEQRPPVYATRGGPRGPGKLVFLHGMCGHGLEYAQAFQQSAAKKGTLIALQGDVPCEDGRTSKWSSDLDAIDARAVAAFQNLGYREPVEDVTVIGMSQGASRADELASRFPRRYTRLILIAAPSALKIGELRQLRGAVLMAGERERTDLMLASERALEASGVPATFMLIPDAAHGELGSTPEQTMGAALDWLWTNVRPLGAGSAATAENLAVDP